MRTATKQEAINGNSNDTVITPLRLKQVLSNVDINPGGGGGGSSDAPVYSAGEGISITNNVISNTITKTSQLTNDSNFITEADLPDININDPVPINSIWDYEGDTVPDGFIEVEEEQVVVEETDPTVPAHVKAITIEDIEKWNSGTGNVDLTDYAKKSEIPTKTSQLTNDSNFITSIPSEYVTETELNEAISNIGSGTGNVSSDTINSIMVVDTLPETEVEGVLYLIKEVVKEDDGNLYNPLTAPVLNAYISTSSKIFSSSENVDKSTYLQIEPNTTYKITKTAGATFSIGTCPDEPSSYTSLTVAQKNANGSEQTITSGATDNYLAIFYYTEGEDTLTEEELRNSIVVTVEPEEPTPTNLWENATNMHEYFFDTDKSILDYKDGVNYYSAYIPCESNTKYKITRTLDGYRFRIANTSVIPAQGVSYSNYLKADTLKDIDYTTSSNAQYLVIYYVGSSETLDPTALFNDISVTKVS